MYSRSRLLTVFVSPEPHMQHLSKDGRHREKAIFFISDSYYHRVSRGEKYTLSGVPDYTSRERNYVAMQAKGKE